MENFGLDSYTYNLLIEYFKSQPEIKIVRIYGSRITDNVRLCADVDLFIEGTYQENKVEYFKKQLNSLRHPYRIDIVNVNSSEEITKEFVKSRLKSSKYFYKRCDFYSDENFEENIDENCITNENVPVWCDRFQRRFCFNLNNLLKLIEQVQANREKCNSDIVLETELFSVFKKLYEGCWKTLKDYHNDNGIKMLIPIEILEFSYKNGLINNINIWRDMIIDFSIMTDEEFINVREELFYRLKERYLDEIKFLHEYFQKIKKINSVSR